MVNEGIHFKRHFYEMYCIFICIFISVGFFSITAYKFVAYGLKSPTNQKVFLIGDFHNLGPGTKFNDREEEIDAYQFEAMLEILRATEQLPGDKKMKIFIEVPHGNILYGLSSSQTPKNIESGLMFYTENWSLEKITMENCDIRRVSGAAGLLLQNDPEHVSGLVGVISRWHRTNSDAPIRWLKWFGCRLELLTFQDLLDHHAIWMRQSELYRNSWEAAPIKKAFDILMSYSRGGLRMFKEELAKDASIDLNEKVWEYSIRYWKSHGEEPYKLRSALVWAFSEFLDAYTVQSNTSITE